MKIVKHMVPLLVCLVCATSAFAQRAGISTVDPHTFTANITDNLDTKSVSLRASQTLNPAVRNLVILVPGQSNIADVAPSAYSPAAPGALDQLNLYDGGIYNAVDPLLGNAIIQQVGGHPILRLADNLIAASLFDRILIVPMADGGYTVSDWEVGRAAQKIAVAMRWLKGKGIVAGTNITIIALWGQGEADNIAGTTQAAYTTSFNNIVANSRAAGFTGTWFVPIQTYENAGIPPSHISPTIQAAQAAVVNHPNGVWAGPNADLLIGSTCGGVACRGGDDIHWTDNGSASYASAWQTALHAFGAPF